jgi:hypothetical protein
MIMTNNECVLVDELTTNIYKRGYAEGQKCVSKRVEDEETVEDIYRKGFENGLEQAWECAKRINNMTMDECEKVFGEYRYFGTIAHNLTASEAIAKIKEYEDKQTDEIRVGDEVRIGATPKDCLEPTFVVLCIDKDRVDLMSSAGGYSVLANYDGCYKTGRHFPQIAEVLEQMKGEAE